MEAFGNGGFFPHWHSLVWHLAAACGVARLLGTLGVGTRGAVCGGALFAAHPAMVEAVARVEQLPLLIAGCGSVWCVAASLRNAAGRGGGAATVIWGALALAAHPAAVALTIALPLALRLGSGAQRSRPATAVAGFALAVGLFHAWRSPIGWTGAGGAVIDAARLLVVAVAPWRTEVTPVASFGGAASAAVVSTLLIVTLVAGRFRRRVGIALAVGGTALLPFVCGWPASTPSDPALALSLPWFVAALVLLAARSRIGTGLLATLVVVLAVLTWRRAGDFEDDQTLWERTHAAHPDNAVASLRLAELLRQREPQRATEMLRAVARVVASPELQLRAAAALRDEARAGGRAQEALLQAQAACAAAARLLDSDAARRARIDSQLALAALQIDTGDVAAARESLARAVEVDAQDPAVSAHQALLLLAEAQDAQGRVAADAPQAARARQLLDAALERSPEHYEALLVRARWQLACGEMLSAVHHYQKARQAKPLQPESYLGEADVFLSAQNYERAERIVREGIAAGVDDANLLMRLGVALSAQGRLAAARQYYERYLELRPLAGDVRRALAALIAADAMTKVNQVGTDVLEADARRIRELDPTQAKADLVQGLAARLQHRFAEAIVLFERAREQLPEDEDLRRLLAETLRDRGYELLRGGDRRASALDSLRRFVDLAPPGVPTDAASALLEEECRQQRTQGIAAFKAGRHGDAEAAFRRCLFLQPDQPSPNLDLGMVLLDRGDATDLQAALQCFEVAEAAQRQAQRDASLPVLYQVLTLQRLGRDALARERGRAFLDAPTIAEPSVVQRIEAAIR